MLKIKIERYTQWQATAALLCFLAAPVAGITGGMLTTSWLLNGDLHPLLHAIGLTLLIGAIPILILGGHCLDLLERRQKESQRDNAHGEMRGGALHT